MVTLSLTQEDARRLAGRLETLLTSFRREIAATDAVEFRHELVKDQDLLERVLGQLREG